MKIVFLTGAGMSQESGISTFRDANGLWENHAIEEVATPQGFQRNPELVLEFYNQRRRQLNIVQPNEGHKLIAQLQIQHDVSVITQNVDDLHERAGSKKVLHLHGELRKVRSTLYPKYIVDWHGDLTLADRCPKGGILRPHIVWFGEDVPEILNASKIVKTADRIVIVGTSMQVYPAAGLVDFAQPHAEIFYIDPNPATTGIANIHIIPKKATQGMMDFVESYF